MESKNTGKSGAGSPAMQRAVLSQAQIRSVLVERVETHRQTSGLVAVRVGSNAPRCIAAYGEAADGTLLDANSVLQLGSLTKVFTSLLLADAVVRGEVHFDDPMEKYLPANVDLSRRGARPITLLDLGCHMSGLPRDPDNLITAGVNDPYCDYAIEQLYEFLANHELAQEPGTRFEYSNLGMALLGHVLALRAGMPYEELLAVRITRPLGMTLTGIRLTADLERHFAPGHSATFEPVPFRSSTTLPGAAALLSSGNDMATFLEAVLGHRQTPLTVAFELMAKTRRTQPSDPAGAPQLFQIGLGLGWRRGHGSEFGILSGRSMGYRSWLGVERATRTGVVVLSNTDGPGEPDDIGMHLLHSGFPLVQRFASPPRARKAIEIDPSLCDRYLGRYSFSPGVHMRIFRDGGRLLQQFDAQGAAEIFPETERDFFLKSVDAQISFETDALGSAIALILRQNGREQRAIRIQDPPAALQRIPLDSQMMDKCVGIYRFPPAMTLMVSRSGERLLAQVDRQAPIEIFAFGTCEFFCESVGVTLTFEVATDAHATAVVLHRNGVDWRGLRSS